MTPADRCSYTWQAGVRHDCHRPAGHNAHHSCPCGAGEDDKTLRGRGHYEGDDPGREEMRRRQQVSICSHGLGVCYGTCREARRG